MSLHRPRRHAPATARNRRPILDVLRTALPSAGLVLEIASGTGEHAAYMAPRLGPGIVWQPSEADMDALVDIDEHARESRCLTIRPALYLNVAEHDWPIDEADAIFCSNMIHIAPWPATEGLFAGAARLLDVGAPIILYGPFKRNGDHTAQSNAAFDAQLRSQDERWGLRCLDTEVAPLAAECGFTIDAVVPMPANNLTVVFRRHEMPAA
ncbi:DUF938 domain-containing protein [Fodinicurvata sp. EGI_FJ10296]|uniref:DUF938 domain-containing protein n=1 Tax=Fodinicurvata sp. EGI_FJ10296 TaxID=3231908 RepID=UPI00345488BE